MKTKLYTISGSVASLISLNSFLSTPLNRLRIEALPLFPVQPTASGLATTGFTKDDFTWPIWTEPVSCPTVRALLSLAEIQEPTPDRQLLTAMGIAEVFRSRRVRIGQGANFKVSFRPSRSA